MQDQEEKSLGKIAYEAAQNCYGGWNWDAAAHAVKAAVLACQPAPASLGNIEQITREAINFTRKGMKHFWWPTFDNFGLDSQAGFVGLVRHVLATYCGGSSVAPAPAFFVTAEKQPTRKDSDVDGQVLAWDSWRWKTVRWDQIGVLPFWMPMPPEPIPKQTAEEKAIEDALKAESVTSVDGAMDTFRALFKAGMTFAASQKGGI